MLYPVPECMDRNCFSSAGKAQVVDPSRNSGHGSTGAVREISAELQKAEGLRPLVVYMYIILVQIRFDSGFGSSDKID